MIMIRMSLGGQKKSSTTNNSPLSETEVATIKRDSSSKLPQPTGEHIEL